MGDHPLKSYLGLRYAIGDPLIPTQPLLRMWTIYAHPLDFPDSFVVRGHTATASGSVADPEPLAVTSTLIDAQAALLHLVGPALYCLPREPDDDPIIVETWI